MAASEDSGVRQAEVVVFDVAACVGHVETATIADVGDSVRVFVGDRSATWSRALLAERRELAIEARRWEQRAAAARGPR
jgi:hypothetical protein